MTTPDRHRRVGEGIPGPAERAGAIPSASTKSFVGDAPNEHVPERIGQYRIVRVLGRGGMGVVYLAQQEHPKRAVALKVTNSGVATRSMLARFEHEAQVLARLQHPGIAQIYEAGTAIGPSGEPTPYFAMELIHGEPITEFASKRNLGTAERMALLSKVCEAVHHAHQRGVIHRDLKPSNILVDESGQPKVLDFGVARALDSDVQRTTLNTDIGQLVGTIPYMSPEQAGGDSATIDTRSDVYALGVIAYELLAGRPPYEMKGRLIHEAVRVIREEDPTPLSSVSRVFRGDVETIVAKALEKEPRRRYQSASELASDIGRYLRDEPIAARPPSARYQLQKFARRHRALVGAATGVVLALVAGTAVATWQAVRASSQAAKAREAVKLMTHVISGIDPRTAKGMDTALVQLLMTEAERQLRVRKIDSPEVEAELRHAIGTVYLNTGMFDRAEPMLNTAVELMQTAGDSHRIFSFQNDLAEVFRQQKRYDLAEPLYREALAGQRRELGLEHHDTVVTLNNLAGLCWFQKRYGEAESLLREAVEAGDRGLGSDDDLVLLMRSNLAQLYRDSGQPERAEELFVRALADQRRVLGDDHPYTITSQFNLGKLLRDTGRAQAGELLLRESAERSVHVLGVLHPESVMAVNDLVRLYDEMRRYPDAVPWRRGQYEAALRAYGEADQRTLNYMNWYAGELLASERYADAESLQREELRVRQAHGLPFGATQYAIANTYLAEDRYAEAEPLLRDYVAVVRQKFPESSMLGSIQISLGHALVETGKFDEAEALLRECVRLTAGDDQNRVPRGVAMVWLGKALAGQGRSAEAEASLLQGWTELEATKSRVVQIRAIAAIASFYDEISRPDEAATWRAKLDDVRAPPPPTPSK